MGRPTGDDAPRHPKTSRYFLLASVCLYFQLHQPLRLRRYSVFDSAPDYFDDSRNQEILLRVARKCYLPATGILLEAIRHQEGRFRVAFSLSGSLIEQLQTHAPEVIDRFRDLAETGCCEFLAETSHHSLASLYSATEFNEQRQLHAGWIESLFGQSPSVFRNTELIYSDRLAGQLADTGAYRAVLAEGVDRLLAGRRPGHLYRAAGTSRPLAVLLRDYRRSDDLAFRFSNQQWEHWPLTAERYADWLVQPPEGADAAGPLRNVFLDFETFGEHQWAETGILDFLTALPAAVLDRGGEFRTPSECLESFAPVDTYASPEVSSWADTERDLSAWVGNAMQSSALQELFGLEKAVKARHDAELLATWRHLTTSDHFYYMCTKWLQDGVVHRYFSPYESPYDAYINYMNVLDHFRSRLD